MADNDAASDIAAWLERLGLGQYSATFAENDIDSALLPRLDHEILKGIGVVSAGHRLRILDAVATMAARSATVQPGTPTSAEHTGGAGEPTQAERRQLTVMFCDLVGSTDLSARLDAEAFRDVVRAYQQAVEGVTQRFDGHVAQYLGDGLLVYFGYPVAHEDDAARAVYAGIGIPAALEQLNPQFMADHSVRLTARIGIHTGPVVVGEMGGTTRNETLALGETPNVAARLQVAAAPGATVISARTRQLVGQLFELEPLGDLNLKGIDAPMQAFVVTGERSSETRFASRRVASVAAMVGRQSELALLLDRWRQAKSGSGQVVVLTGEAGIGKSRIASALVDALASEPHQRVSYQCSPFHMGTALYPIVRQLTRAAAFGANDSLEARLDKLEGLLIREQPDLSTSAPLLGALLGVGELAEARHGMIALSPEQRRDRTLHVLLDRLVCAADRNPVLVVLEDAHWIDPTTRHLVELLLGRIDGRRILVLVTARPAFDGGFGGHPVVSHLSLNRLGRDSVFEIVGGVTQGKSLPPELLREIAARTDGVPLFVEELTKTLLESGQLRDTDQGYQFDGQIDGLTIPTSLRDTLMARLDRAHEIKEVAQTAACIGREFTWSLLAAVSPLPQPQLAAALEQLVNAELIFRRGVAAESTYTFKHALVRDAAYESLLRARRRAIHDALLTHLQTDESVPSQVLAHHAAAAGRVSEAADYWEQAGGRAAARSSFGEAIGHFEQALQAVRTSGAPPQPESADGAGERMLRLELRLAHACVAGRGHGSPLTMQAFKRATALADGLGPSTLRVAAYYGSSVTHMVRSELHEAAAVARVMSQDIAGDDDDERHLMAHCCLATTAMLSGDFRGAHDRFESVLNLTGEMTTASLVRQFGHEPRGVARCDFAIALWCMGYPERAADMWQQGMQVASASDHTPSQAQPKVFGALLATLSRAGGVLEQRIDEAVAFTEQHGFHMWRGFAMCLRAGAELAHGDLAAARTSVLDGRAALEATGTRFLSPLVSVIGARVLAALGEPDRALALLNEAQRHQDATGERWMAAEVWRSIGDVHRRTPDGNAEAAEAAFLRAVEVAHEQGALSWELRAAVSLADVWVERGERRRAGELLQRLCDQRALAVDTADMADARRMLAMTHGPRSDRVSAGGDPRDDRPSHRRVPGKGPPG